MPYHRDIGYLYATGGQRRAKCRASSRSQPRGCQITSTVVRIKIVPASNIVPPPITFENHIC